MLLRSGLFFFLLLVVAIPALRVAPGRQPGPLLRGGDPISLLERLLLLVRPLRPRVSRRCHRGRRSCVVGDILVSAEHFLFRRPAAVLLPFHVAPWRQPRPPEICVVCLSWPLPVEFFPIICSLLSEASSCEKGASKK
jgi:hypothetical protein